MHFQGCCRYVIIVLKYPVTVIIISYLSQWSYDWINFTQLSLVHNASVTRYNNKHPGSYSVPQKESRIRGF